MRRPRFQFRLRTLFVMMTIVAVACWHVSGEWRAVHARRSYISRNQNVFDGPDSTDTPTWLCRRFGDKCHGLVILHDGATEDDFSEAKALFPEADVVSGPAPIAGTLSTEP